MKALLTENNRQEILKILRERKAKSKSVNMIFIIEDIRKYSAIFFENDLIDSNYFFDKKIKVVESLSDNFYITGVSDKTYLSDCITRLSQGTKNFINSIKQHNYSIEKKNFLESIKGEKVENEELYKLELLTFLNLTKDALNVKFSKDSLSKIIFVQKQFHVLNNGVKTYTTFVKNHLKVKRRNKKKMTFSTPSLNVKLTGDMSDLREIIINILK